MQTRSMCSSNSISSLGNSRRITARNRASFRAGILACRASDRLEEAGIPHSQSTCETRLARAPKALTSWPPIIRERGTVVHLPALFLQETLQVFLTRQCELVLGDEQAAVHAGERVLHQSMVFLRAEQQAHRRVVVFGHHVPPTPGDVGVELAEVFVAELVYFQLDEHMALENALIEDEVHEAACLADDNPLLPRLETETMAQFQEKILQLVEQGILQVGFAHGLLWPKAEKLENIRVTNSEFRLGLFGGAVGQRRKLFLFSLLVESPERSKYRVAI